MDTFGQIRMSLDKFRQVSTNFDKFRWVWTITNQSESFSSLLNYLTPLTWPNLPWPTLTRPDSPWHVSSEPFWPILHQFLWNYHEISHEKSDYNQIGVKSINSPLNSFGGFLNTFLTFECLLLLECLLDAFGCLLDVFLDAFWCFLDVLWIHLYTFWISFGCFLMFFEYLLDAFWKNFSIWALPNNRNFIYLSKQT